ncbi:hypothetical protein B9Z55_005738 [Caenorhabditis nigoni]|uniref:Uncharacterized protein n=1 Tax=Caenorhabditis nigoni TaxID=1611254 RepID=A0A2G5V250_9PELO|nr:hypothetical protein B9Z55_005738 [Caenorhabditis nigoni]
MKACDDSLRSENKKHLVAPLRRLLLVMDLGCVSKWDSSHDEEGLYLLLLLLRLLILLDLSSLTPFFITRGDNGWPHGD